MRLLLSVLLALVLLAGCDSAEDPAPLASTALLPDEARYTWSIESHLIENDSLLFGDGTEVTVRAVSRNASVPGYEGLVEMETQTATGRSQTWYELTAEQLRGVAYQSAGATPLSSPRVVAGHGDLFGLPRVVAKRIQQHTYTRGVSVDSLIVRDEPRVVYELPLEVGAGWVSFTDPFRSTRAVVGRETVEVEAGTFDCFVIRTEIDIAAQFEWFDYVSVEHGLVLRTTERVGEYRGPDNQPLGLMRTVERLELIAGD